MTTATLTRAELIDAIEQAIACVPALTDADASALRTVARMTDKVARGTYVYGGCGCPATQAGLVPDDEDGPTSAVETFAFNFDVKSRNKTGGYPNLIEAI
jgi:hypothetical protein